MYSTLVNFFFQKKIVFSPKRKFYTKNCQKHIVNTFLTVFVENWLLGEKKIFFEIIDQGTIHETGLETRQNHDFSILGCPPLCDPKMAYKFDEGCYKRILGAVHE